jgi:hypothetical protein
VTVTDNSFGKRVDTVTNKFVNIDQQIKKQEHEILKEKHKRCGFQKGNKGGGAHRKGYFYPCPKEFGKCDFQGYTNGAIYCMTDKPICVNL